MPRRHQTPIRLEDLFDWAVPPMEKSNRSGGSGDPRGADDPLPRAENSPEPNVIERMDRRLAELGRADGRWRLQLGDLLERFTRLGGPTYFASPSPGAYGVQFVGRTARWCDDSRAMARRLDELPLLRAALATGRMGWSMIELLSRHATAATEADLLLAARGKTVRAMKETLLAASDETPPPDSERSTLETTVPVDDAWAYEFVRILLDRGLGCRTTDEAIEGMLAEGSVTLSVLEPELDIPLGPPEDVTAQWRHEQAERDAAIEAELEGRVDISWDAGFEPLASIDSLSQDIHVLHDEIQKLALEYAARDLELGHLARRFWAAKGWLTLGFTSDTQYARERVGCALRSVQERMRLVRGVDAMPEVEAALRDNVIGFESALLILRRTRPEFAADWVARAKERTVVELRNDLEVACGLARANGSVAYLAPPSEEAVAGYERARASVLSGAAFVEGSPEEIPRVGMKTQISGEGDEPPRRGTGMRTLRLTMAHDLARWWRQLKRGWRVASCGADLGSTFLEFLCGATVSAWLPTVREAQKVKYAHIHARDGYRCANPVCNRRDVTLHHLTFRSRGGGEEDANLISVCSKCHLDLIHGGFIRAQGPADGIRWLLGRVPQMEVHGRVKLACVGAVDPAARETDPRAAPLQPEYDRSRKGRWSFEQGGVRYVVFGGVAVGEALARPLAAA